MDEVILLRHGETHGYDGDHGLTARGEEQARARGAALAPELAGRRVVMPRARTARATATAEVVRKTLLDAGVEAGEPYPVPAFDNLRFALHGEVVDASVAVRARLALPTGERPHWAGEYDRFDSDFGEVSRAGGPIAHWLHTPGLWFEPPQVAAYRLWAGVTGLAADPAPVAVVATHSAPMRAFVVAVFGDDREGEPENLEEIRVLLDGDARTVRFRDRETTFDRTPALPPWYTPTATG